MKKVKGVKKYAKQFLKSVNIDDVPLIIDQYSSIAALIEKDKMIRNALISPTLSPEEHRKVIRVITGMVKMPDNAVQFLIHLAETMILGSLAEIVKAITALYLELMRRVKAVVTAPVALSKEIEVQLTKSLRELTGRSIDYEFVLDPSLIGGMRIQIGSTMYDSSIKGQLGLLRDKLIKG